MNKTNDHKKRVAGYIRVSTGIQAEEGESLDTQKAQIQEHCEKNKWELIKIYEDAGISGGKAEKRPAFMEMVKNAKAGEFDVILFTKLSRFARNATDYHNFQKELEGHGVNLCSIKEGIDPSTFNGKLIAGIFALLAEWEREMIREQMAENKMAKWRDKRMFTGHAPYGYYWDKKACKFMENEEEAKILNLMFNWYTKLGLSMRGLIERLNSEGYRSRRAKWTNGSISGIFKNPCYSSCKLVTNTRIYKDSKRTKKLKPESEWITFDLPRIVPKSLCDRVEKRREFNIKKQKRTLWQQDHWLRSSLICGKCGSRMRVRKGNTRVDGTSTKYYICHWSCCTTRDLKLENREKCKQGNVPSDHLERYVWDEICFRITGSHADTDKENELQDKAVEQFSFLTGGNVTERIEDIEGKINRLKQEKQKKERANNRLLDMLEDEEMDFDSLRSKLRINEDIIATLNEDIYNAENDLLELRQLLEDQESYFNSKNLLFKIWSDLQDFSPEDKKRLLESLVPDGITITIGANPHPGKSHFKRLGPENVCFDLVWNPLIFQHFEEEGKFSSFDQNSSNYFAPDEF